jgi:F0F1-type ATP synthase assembly protein I
MASDNTNLKQAMFTVSDGVIGAAVLVAAGIFGGQWLDNHFHTAPMYTIVLSIIGGGLGLGRLVMKAMKIGSESPAPDPKKMIDLSESDNDSPQD